MIVINLIVHGESIVWMNEITDKVTVHGLKLEIGNWGEQYKSMKAKFPISTFYFQRSVNAYQIKTLYYINKSVNYILNS